MRDGKMILEEIYRFSNGMKSVDGSLCWDVADLFHQIKQGMKRCKLLGKIPVRMGIDTWGVDFVLLDRQDKILGQAVGYRDERTQGMDSRVYEKISQDDLYARTGIQKQIFNTIYQLMAVKERHPEQLALAETMLMIPDYFHYLLTGVKKQEYTNATTTQLVNPVTKEWDLELIKLLRYPTKLFMPLSMPGTVVGELSKAMQQEIGYSCKVVLPATHDTASAVLAVPSHESDLLYISSGTWSLMGTERMEVDCSVQSRNHNFTNEGGYAYRFRYLKSIMGLWMIQSVKKEWKEKFQEDYSFAELCERAAAESILSIVDCNDPRFLAPKSMIAEVQDYCRAAGRQVPQTPGEISAVIYNSLAQCYGETVRELEEATGKHYKQIHIVGGGANADYLNQLTAQHTGLPVYAGPTEATAIGNLVAQMIGAGEFQDLEEARTAIFHSFSIQHYEE
ncbi:MAG: rhamnulokinase family protein, partial [Hungatella sp.]